MVFNRKPEQRSTEPAAVEVLPIAQNNGQSQGYRRPGAPVEQDQSIIGSNLSIEGQSITIRCKGSLMVNGNIHADIHSSALVVGEDGTVAGSISAETVDIHGKVNGSIHSTNVVLHATAEVDGDIQSAFLTIARGASFDGSSRRVKEGDVVQPVLDGPNARSSGPRSAPASAASAPQSPYGSQVHPLHN